MAGKLRMDMGLNEARDFQRHLMGCLLRKKSSKSVMLREKVDLPIRLAKQEDIVRTV
jgi:hypothetical protein